MTGGRLRVAAYAFARADGALLLTRIAAGYPSAGAWTLPGGGLEFGEAPEDALHRELREETGLTGTIDGILGINSIVLAPAPRRPEPLHGLRVVYQVTCVGSPQHEEGGSTDRAAWVPLDQLDALPRVELVDYALGIGG